MKEKESEPQKECPHCHSIHLGQTFDDCPLLHAKPCSICGKDTVYCCSDCMIERREKVFVCVDSQCRDAHEKQHPEHPQPLTASAQLSTKWLSVNGNRVDAERIANWFFQVDDARQKECMELVNIAIAQARQPH